MSSNGFDDLAFHLVRWRLAGLECDKGVDRVTLDIVRVTDHRGLRYRRVSADCALDFSAAKVVPGHDDDVVYTSGYPVVAVLVA